MEKYSKTSDDEADVEIIPPSKPNSNNETQKMEAIVVSPTNSEPITSKDKHVTMEYEDTFEASPHYDEEEDVDVQQHHLAISPGSKVDENVMVQVKQIFYDEFCPIYQKAREACSQMLDKNVYSRFVNIVRMYPMLPKDDRDP
jgi:hypothetical protein